MSNAQDMGSASLGGNFTYAGIANSFVYTINPEIQGSVAQTWNGTANNQSSAVPQNVVNPQGLFVPYSGYMVSFSGQPSASSPETSALMDNQPVYPWSKNQQIYYKLVGFNTSTQSFETWVIAEEIVPRPETFDPTGNFPNVDYNVYFTPPSGNKLVNIKIVGRWIQ